MHALEQDNPRDGGTRSRTTRLALLFVLLAAAVLDAPQTFATCTGQTCQTYTFGYWKNHYPDAWKDGSGLTLGTTFYTNAQLETILGTNPAGGDASVTLAHQLIAALLSIANGTSGAQVQSTINDANAALGAGPIPEGIHASTALGKRMTADAAILANYNNNATVPCGCPPPQPTLHPNACNPTSSLSVLLGPDGVTAYIPNGNWGSTQTGIQVVPISPAGTPTSIATPGVVNSCATNSVTENTVCVANDSDVYLINGTTLQSTLTSATTGTTSFSGGNCQNCGVVIESNSNTAAIEMALSSSSSGTAIQFLDLSDNTLATPTPTANGISEDILWDPIRSLLLSPAENGIYDIVQYNSGVPAEYGNNIGGELDSAAEDCLTGIALATDEYTNNIVLADLTQAAYTSGSPGTWTAPLQFQSIPEWAAYEGPESGTDGIAIVTGTHYGIVIGEYPFPPSQANAVMAIQLPATSGSGTPALVDYAVATLPNDPAGYVFSIGCDPHTVAAYVDPATGNPTGLLTDYGALTCYSGGTPQYVATVNLEALLAAPRLSGTHNVDPTYDLVANQIVTFVAAQ